MDFALFLLVNATLFIRPAEIVPDLAAVPVYNAIILLNLAVAAPKVAALASPGALRRDPIAACVVGFLVAIVLSQVARLNFLLAREAAVEFAKVVLYYLLLVGVIDSPARLRRFLAALACFVLVQATLSLLHYHGSINIPALDAVADREVDPRTGEEFMVMRLCSTGMYNDPNDFALVLLVATGACLFLASPPPGRLPRPWWLAPAALFLYALTLTHSRGGFLAMLAGMVVLLDARYGRSKAVLIASLMLPALFVVFAGRQTDITTEGDTGQDRIRLWSSGLLMLRESPAVGIGYGHFADRADLVAHNSYIHAFAELGFGGGALFLGAFALAFRTFRGLGGPGVLDPRGDLGRVRPFLLAMLVAYAFGMLSLSRHYVVSTYMILGLASAFFRLAGAAAPNLAAPGGPIPTVDLRLIGWVAGVASLFLVVAQGFVIAAARW